MLNRGRQLGARSEPLLLVAMVITSGVERTILHYHAVRDHLSERKSPDRAFAAFSVAHEYGRVKVPPVDGRRRIPFVTKRAGPNARRQS